MSTRKSRTRDESLNALGVVAQIIAEELGQDDPRYHLIRALPESWDKHDAARWEAARNALEHDAIQPNEPLLRPVALGVLVTISDALGDFFAGRPCDPRQGPVRACALEAMVDHLGRIVAEVTRDYREALPEAS